MKNIKAILFVGIFLQLSNLSQAQVQFNKETLSEKGVKELVIENIEINRAKTSDSLANELSKLEKRIVSIDSQLKLTSVNDKTKIDKLYERVQTIEQIQNAVNQNELNIYQTNYQSAVINLVAMERELKPLVLFQATKDFFEDLSQVSNPTTYPGYEKWFKQFKAYVEENKSKEASLSVVSSLVNLTGNMAKGTPLTGPLTQALFVGMSNYVNTISFKRKEQRLESEKMFELTMILSQFTHEQSQIESEWGNINKELEDLKNTYQKGLDKNLNLLGINKANFDQNYARESDAKKRLDYLNDLTNIISKKVEIERNANPKNWKESFYYEMTTIQAMKVRFGSITFRIRENIDRYQLLFEKYRLHPIIGKGIVELEGKLKFMRDAFDSTFEPLEYINAASRMYKVE